MGQNILFKNLSPSHCFPDPWNYNIWENFNINVFWKCFWLFFIFKDIIRIETDTSIP